METPIFLTLDETIILHDLQLEHFGGLAGIRDLGLLESALAMPQAGFGEMAAAYVFHLVKNHAFLDGNKRIGFHAAYVFMRLNGVELHTSQESAYDLVIATAEGRANKAEIAEAFRQHSSVR